MLELGVSGLINHVDRDTVDKIIQADISGMLIQVVIEKRRCSAEIRKLNMKVTDVFDGS